MLQNFECTTKLSTTYSCIPGGKLTMKVTNTMKATNTAVGKYFIE